MVIDKIKFGGSMEEKHMKEKKIIIGVMCALICIMAVAYAAFATNLVINGTASIESTWSVVFTKIEEVSKTSGVTITEVPTASGTTATFNVDLKSPGDKIEYQITVSNQGTLDAIIENVKLGESGSDAIKFEVTGINIGDTLVKKASTTFNVTISYDENVTEQPDILNNKLTVNITYIQKLDGDNVIIPTSVGSMDNNNTITLNSSLPSGIYTLKYEDNDGIMEEYADITTLEITKTGNNVIYDDFIKQNVAPQGARVIGTYNESGTRVGSIPFSSTFSPDLGKKLYSFGALADIHISGSETDANFAEALTRLNTIEKVDFICIPGDLTDSATDEQWTLYKNMIATYSPNTLVYESTGNHDTPYYYRNGYNNEDLTENTTLKDKIETSTGNSLYYSFNRGNDVFIMVGVQSNREGMSFSQNELQWLYETLETNRNKRCFVFIHILPDNGSGNVNTWYKNDNWGGTEQQVLESLLSHYPNIILFHAHSHQPFEMQEDSATATYIKQFGIHSFHIPSAAATRGPTSEYFGKSEGYAIDVYENGIILKGLDFANNKYLPIAQYYLNTTIKTVKANTYDDATATINCEKANIEWIDQTHVDKSTGTVSTRAEYASSNLIPIKTDKITYFHTFYNSPYGVDICCYDKNGNYLGYVTISLNNDNKYTAPIKLNSIVKSGTTSIRLRMWVGTYFTRKVSPIFITYKNV